MPQDLQIHMFPCLQDNYGFLLHDPKNKLTASVDTPDATAIEKALVQKNWALTHIFNTHHHWDHTDGNLTLKSKTGCTIIGPKADAARIPGIDTAVGEEDVFQWGEYTLHVYDTPGHTRGHIVYHLPQQHIAFVGDTLFAMGCGRLFEGTPAQMWTSLQKLLQWPDDTVIYCAHEYTETNARFALSVEPNNPDLIRRAAEVSQLRTRGLPTIPTTLGLEKKTNPFLRPHSTMIQEILNLTGRPLIEIFTRLRSLKDRF